MKNTSILNLYQRLVSYIIILFTSLQFAIAQAPTISSFSPASGRVGGLVTITGTNLSSPTAITIGGATAIPVSNSGTQLVAMVMTGAATGIVSVTTVSGTANSATNFTVLTSLPPNTQVGTKLVGTGNLTAAAREGENVAISADGNTAVVGTSFDNSTNGGFWIFILSGGVWVQQGPRLAGTGNIGAAQQAQSVAISADGNTVVIGGDNDNSGQGALWVFTRTAGAWSQQGAKLVGTGNIGTARLGQTVSVSADGNTIVAGGPGDNTNKGATWVFTRSGSTWTQQGSKLVGTGSVGGFVLQGNSISISADGNTAAIAGEADNSNQGAVWIFTRSGSTWTQQGAKLVGTGNVGAANQGHSVSISADGNTLISGGYFDNSSQGAIWVFTRTGTTWAQQGAKLIATGSIGTPIYQGGAVSVSADGNTFVTAGYGDNSFQGGVWLFTRTAGVWTQQGSKIMGTGNIGFATQGVSNALSADGNTLIIGGYTDNSNLGAAWVFVNSATLLPLQLISFTGYKTTDINQLQWITVNETHTKEFIIERSTDGSNYNRIATVAAKGKNNTLIYQYADKFQEQPKIYYRLKMVDADGQFTYSNIIVLSNQKDYSLSVYPNPVKNKITLQVGGNKLLNTIARVIDNSGRTVQSFLIKNNVEAINLSKLAAGFYMLQLADGSMQKIIKQ